MAASDPTVTIEASGKPVVERDERWVVWTFGCADACKWCVCVSVCMWVRTRVCACRRVCAGMCVRACMCASASSNTEHWVLSVEDRVSNIEYGVWSYRVWSNDRMVVWCMVVLLGGRVKTGRQENGGSGC